MSDKAKKTKCVSAANVSKMSVTRVPAVMDDEDVSTPEFDTAYRQIAYGKFLRAMLEECMVDEKIEREQTQMDIQLGQLADRFQKTMDLLDKTNRRLKDISFVVEQQRLLNLKTKFCDKFNETTDSSNAQDILQNLTSIEQACLDKLETKNVDFGYNKETGHKQLLDAVTEALDGLDQIKKQHSYADSKFQQYQSSETHLNELENERLTLEGLKTDFNDKFPKLNEKLLLDASEKMVMMMDDEVLKSDDDSSRKCKEQKK